MCAIFNTINQQYLNLKTTFSLCNKIYCDHDLDTFRTYRTVNKFIILFIYFYLLNLLSD